MANRTKIEISAEDKSASGVNSAISNLKRFDSEVSQVTKTFDKLKNIGFVTAIVGGLQQFGQKAAECAEEYSDFELKALKLQGALKGNDAVFSRLTSYMDSVARTTTVSKDSIEALVTEMVGLGKSASEIETMTSAAVRLSEVTGSDLSSSFTLLQGTLTGSAGKLEKLIPGIGNLTKAQLESGDAIELVNSKFADFSSKIGDSYAVKLKNYREASADLKEAIGGFTSGFFAPILESLTKIFTKWSEIINLRNSYTRSMQGHGTLSDDLATEKAKLAEIQKARRTESVKVGYDPEYWNAMERAQMLAIQGLTMKLEDQKKAAEEGEKASEATKTTATNLSNAFGSISDRVREYQRSLLALIAANKPSGLNITDGPTSYNQVESDDDIRKWNQTQLAWLKNSNPDPTPKGSGLDLGLGGLGKIGDLLKSIGGIFTRFAQSLGSLASVQAILDPLGVVLEGIMQVIGPLIDSALKPLLDMLSSLGQQIGIALIPIFEVLTPIIAALAESLGAILVPIIQGLTPMIEFLGEAFLWLWNKVIRHVYNGVLVIFNGLSNAFAALYNVVSAIIRGITFGTVDIGRKDYVSLDTGFVGEIERKKIERPSGTNLYQGTSNYGTAASYNARGDTIVNFYVQAPVVGSGGMQEFAGIVVAEIKELGVLGR